MVYTALKHSEERMLSKRVHVTINATYIIYIYIYLFRLCLM